MTRMAGTTRPSLLDRLRDGTDRHSWEQFFDQYWRLIYSFARKCGLSASDAEDVLQEVVLKVFRAMPTMTYDRTKGTFRAYLREEVSKGRETIGGRSWSLNQSGSGTLSRFNLNESSVRREPVTTRPRSSMTQVRPPPVSRSTAKLSFTKRP